MRKRFHDLGAKKASIEAKSAQLRKRRNDLIAQHTADVKALEAEIRTAEGGLYDIDVERGFIAKALGGRTGKP